MSWFLPQKKEATPFDDDDELPAIFKQRGQENRQVYKMQAQIRKNHQLEKEAKHAKHQDHIHKRQQICVELNDNGIPEYKRYYPHDDIVKDYQAGVLPLDRHYYYFAEPKTYTDVRRPKSIDDVLQTAHYSVVTRQIRGIPNRLWDAMIERLLDDYLTTIGANQVNEFKLVHHHNTIKLAVVKLHWLLRGFHNLWQQEYTLRAFSVLVHALCDYNAQRYAGAELCNMAATVVENLGPLQPTYTHLVVDAILEAKCIQDHPENFLFVIELLMLSGMVHLYEEIIKRFKPDDNTETTPEVASVVVASLPDPVESTESPPEATTREPTPVSTRSPTPGPTSPIVTPVSRSRKRKTPKPKQFPPIDELKLLMTEYGVIDDSSLHALDHISRLCLPDRVALAIPSISALTPLISLRLPDTVHAETMTRLINIRDTFTRFKNQFIDANNRGSPHRQLMAVGLGIVAFWIMVLDTKVGLVKDDIFYGDKQGKRRKLGR